MRCILLAAAVALAGAFAPASSNLPTIRRMKAQCSLVMKSEEDIAAENLAKRRVVVGGLFALLAPIAGLPEGADAAKSGGRMGGGSFRPKSAPGGGARGRSAPATAPTVINRPSVTVIQSAPSMPFGYGGYGGGMFGKIANFQRSVDHSRIRALLAVCHLKGDWNGCVTGGGYGFGLTPGQFLGLSAIELAESIARENRRRAYLEQQMKIQRELGKDQAEIDALQKQLAEVSDLCAE